MTKLELLHRLKERASTARYISLTPEYGKQQLDKVLEEIEWFSQELIDMRYQDEEKKNDRARDKTI